MHSFEQTRSHLFGQSLDLRIGAGIYNKLTRFTAMQLTQKMFFFNSFNYIFLVFLPKPTQTGCMQVKLW